ncbi:MAG: phosphoadenylyl-sulfate reductase [Halorhodospira sp.]
MSEGDSHQPKVALEAGPGLFSRVQEALALLQHTEAELSPAALASSLSVEDMVLLDLIYRHGILIEVFTLDTGRLALETYELHQRIRECYGPMLQTYYPRAEDVERFVAAYGINGFYESIEARQACCQARKVMPLKRALRGKRAWVTGMRREQSVTRVQLPLRDYDQAHGLAKINPLANWREEEVWAYIHRFEVPYNALYDQGYRSIGCAPCTRPIAAGEDLRAGRWWWEQPEHRECGLHA